MVRVLQVYYKQFEDNHFYAKTASGKTITLKCNTQQTQELRSIQPFITEGNTFNLLNISENSDDTISAEFIIFEPGYLMDISALAECFRPYGCHPFNYILSRLQMQNNSRHILLGNSANFFMDELINERDNSPLDYPTVLMKLFRASPFEFTSCDDLKDPTLEKKFFESCKIQYNNINHCVKAFFPKANIDKYNSIIEPSYICGTLGLQGRMDLILQDISAFIELKSGKGKEDFRTQSFIGSAENHYIQMILYLAVLEFNFGLDHESIRSYLLYSKYPILSKETHCRKLLSNALYIRNSITALDFNIQNTNKKEYTKNILLKIKPEALNTKKLTGNFFDNYLRPPIDKFGKTMESLTEVEKAYFMSIYTFITKELWLSKLGEKEYEGVKKAANLWNAPREDKILAGELLYDLQITDNLADHESRAITLKIPMYETYLPNFREGDTIILYERNSDSDHVNNKQIFKGSIEYIRPDEIKICLRARQNNISVLPTDSLYAIEHDYMDISYNAMYRALITFAEGNKDRRDLVLAQRPPEFDHPIRENGTDIHRIVEKANTAKDIFLLVGPPGTGKTSLALRKMVEQHLEEETGNILLMAYTNRAVDEICKTLFSQKDQPFFIRIGNELSCGKDYRDYLLENCLKKCNNRKEVRTLIDRCRIFVGTVSSIWNKPDLFRLKQFRIAVIDEATQLLDPHLLGILCIKAPSGGNAIDRFILIGDHKQLPAVVLQPREESRVEDPLLIESGITNLSNSLFERLYIFYRKNGWDQSYDILTKQGRMHPEIAHFPSTYFYENKLKCVGLNHQIVDLPYREPHDDIWDNLIANYRLAFISCNGTGSGNPEKINHREADVVVELINSLIDHYERNNIPVHKDSIGVITPFRNQIALIYRTMQEKGYKKYIPDITVDTVERFQGSQKDVIIYSFCINNRNQLNTLPNITIENNIEIDRKLNVVLTRARKQLFITGNDQLLSGNRLYNELINHIRNHGIIIRYPFTTH